jgi:hypothetical protein
MRVNAILQEPVCRRCFEGGHEAKDCKENEENFKLIGPLAAFIGARLQYPCPEINGQGNPWVSTIRVDQHKEKWWYVRVYCDLADPSLVQKKWDFLKDRQRRMDAGEKFYWHGWKGLPEMLAASETPTPEFFARCALHDAIHYHKVHMDTVALRPHLRTRICDQADHWVLLHESVDKVDLTPEQEEWQCKKFHVKGHDELVAFLKKVYDPTIRDMMELRD